MVSKVRIVLKAAVAAEDGAVPIRIAKEDPVQAGGELAGDLVDRVIPTGTRWTLNLEVVAVVVVELLERFDDQVIDRHPDRSAPIRVSAKESRGGFAGLIFDREPLPIPLERIWTIAVVLREGTYAIVGQEFRFVEHSTEQLLHAAAPEQRQQPAFALARLVPARHQRRQIWTIVEEPVETLGEGGHLGTELRLERFDGKERDQPDHRAHLERQHLPVRQIEHVVVEPVPLVP